MEWSFVVLGVSLLTLAIGLSIGYFLPKDVFGLVPSLIFIFLCMIVFSLAGIICTWWGLKK